MKSTIENANLVTTLVMPSDREQQFRFTAEGSLAASAVWGLAFAVVQEMKDAEGCEQLISRMRDRVVHIASSVSVSQLTEIANDAAAQMQAQRPDADTREMMMALGGATVDADEQAFFNALDRDEFAKRLASELDYCSNIGGDVSLEVEAWEANKLVAFVERQYLKLAEFHNTSPKFRVAWCRAHGTEIRKQARLTKQNIGEATITYVEGLLDSIGGILDELSVVADEFNQTLELHRELHRDESHPDRQH